MVVAPPTIKTDVITVIRKSTNSNDDFSQNFLKLWKKKQITVFAKRQKKSLIDFERILGAKIQTFNTRVFPNFQKIDSTSFTLMTFSNFICQMKGTTEIFMVDQEMSFQTKQSMSMPSKWFKTKTRFTRFNFLVFWQVMSLTTLFSLSRRKWCKNSCKKHIVAYSFTVCAGHNRTCM